MNRIAHVHVNCTSVPTHKQENIIDVATRACSPECELQSVKGKVESVACKVERLECQVQQSKCEV